MVFRIDPNRKQDRELLERVLGKQAVPPLKKRPKYSNSPQIVDGIKFDSIKEAARYRALKIRERIGEIKDLILQPSFDLVVNGLKVCSYRADFQYVKDGVIVVEDVKSEPTAQKQVYRVKKKLMKAVFGIDILEVQNPNE